MIKILFVGESWLGSCARSLREALARNKDIELEEISEDVGFPIGKSFASRVLNRMGHHIFRVDFENGLLAKIDGFKPDILLVYKGFRIDSRCLRRIKSRGVKTVNVYPDYSPHAYGASHKLAIGNYDLIISTKIFHPERWASIYGYSNRCEFVPQGFDPVLHYRESESKRYEYDLVVVATYREEYGSLMLSLADELADSQIRVAIGGYGWSQIQSELPRAWKCIGEVHGREYIDTLRSSKICLAPLNTEVVILGARQPGDQDTTRTYELAAANCFFIHQSTPYVKELFEGTGLPFFSNAAEVVKHVKYFIDREEERSKIVAAVHALVTERHSLDVRALDIIQLLGTV